MKLVVLILVIVVVSIVAVGAVGTAIYVLIDTVAEEIADSIADDPETPGPTPTSPIVEACTEKVVTFFMVENHSGEDIELIVLAEGPKHRVDELFHTSVGTEEHVIIHALGFPWVEVKEEVCIDVGKLIVYELNTHQHHVSSVTVEDILGGGFVISVRGDCIDIIPGHSPVG